MINTSLDGYFEDQNGNFDWSEPSEEVHALFNDLQRSAGLNLYGRRVYEVMSVWDSDDMFEAVFEEQGAEAHAVAREFAEIWRATEKIVYSRTLETVTTKKTRLEREFDPEAVRRLKAESETDLAVGGPELAGQALRAGLVDEIHLIVHPVVIGAGRKALPDGLRTNLALIDQRRFENGTVYLAYRVEQPSNGYKGDPHESTAGD